ncbi:MAG: alpha-mannosidase [bacterium]
MTIPGATHTYAQPVQEWLILGTYSVEGGRSFDTDFIVSEATVRPHGGMVTAGRAWRHYNTPEAVLDFLDLTLDLFPVEQAVAYAHVYVESPKTDTVALAVNYDDRIVVRANGQVVWQKMESRAHKVSEDTLRVPLREGWNSVLFKIFNRVGEWALAARFLDRSGLTLQAVTPERMVMIARPNPEQIRIRSIEPVDRALYTRENQPAVQFKAVLYNPQQRPLGQCQPRLVTRSGKVVGESKAFDWRAGEIRNVYFIVPVAMILASYEASGSWQIRLQFEKQEVRRVVPWQYDGRLLAKILGTFEVEDVERVAANGSETFRRTIVAPWEWAGMPLLLSADYGQAQGDLFINGEQRGFNVKAYSGDFVLTDSAETGAKFEITVHLNTPARTIDPSAADTSAKAQTPPPRLFLTVENLALVKYLTAANLLQQFRGDLLDEQRALDEKMFAALKKREVRTLNQVIEQAHSKLPAIPEAEKSVPNVSLAGYSHPKLEGQSSFVEFVDAYRHTSRQVLNNLEKYPGFHYAQGQAATFWWLEQQDPPLFESMRAAVAQNRWEIVGGTWVECDLNLPSGESLARQFLYGKRYFKEKFGREPKTAWMPSVFGHSANMPQVLRKSGMSSYLFYRPWESMRVFEWEGLDGTRVASYRPPDWYDTGLTRDVGRQALISKQRFNWPKALRLYGVSDRSSAPSGRDIRLAEDLAFVTAGRAGHPAVPSVRMTRADGFFEELTSKPRGLFLHRGEINFVHPGAWVSQARHKSNNRRCEMLLPAAEAFALFAREFGYTYPQAEFMHDWQNVLVNQQQELFAGAGASEELYQEAQRLQREAAETAKAALDKAMTKIEAGINTQGRQPQEVPVAIYNASAWPRTDGVEIDVEVTPAPVRKKSEAAKKGKASKKEKQDEEEKTVPEPALFMRDASGSRLPTQTLWRDSTANGWHYRLLFLPEQVPACGYKIYWLYWDRPEEELPHRVRIDGSEMAMSNRDLSIVVDARTGALQKLVDSQLNREWMASNQGGLQMLGEKAGEATALNIVFDGTRDTLVSATGTEVIEAGPLRGKLRTKFQFGDSEIVQEYIMYATLPRVEVCYDVKWSERNKALQLVFPFAILDGKLHMEIPFGALSRSADAQPLPLQKWLDVSNDQFGLTVANEGVHAVEIQNSKLSFSPLRSPLSPNPKADAGEHKFALALMPHKGDWKQAHAVRMGYDFNQPLLARVLTQQTGQLPAQYSFFSIEPATVMLSALKKAEDDDSWVVRVYETTGTPVTATLALPFVATAVSEVNLIEWEEKPTPLAGTKFSVNLNAWEVKTLKIRGRK